MECLWHIVFCGLKLFPDWNTIVALTSYYITQCIHTSRRYHSIPDMYNFYVTLKKKYVNIDQKRIKIMWATHAIFNFLVALE
jgi:hypothetical protein